MDELDQILEAWGGLEGQNRRAVLATVVHVTGSAYRRPGARMLLIPDGRRIGTVSGGCLEAEIGRKAWWHTEGSQSVVRAYDTTSDDSVQWEFGLGCNGVVQILLERCENEDAAESLQFLASQRALQKPALIATFLRGEGAATGQRLLADETGAVQCGRLHRSLFASQLVPHFLLAAQQTKSRLVHLPQGKFFVEWIPAPLQLTVFGAGHDAIPLVAIANQLGWRVTVADGRPAYARAERFPKTARVILMSAQNPLREILISPSTAVVLMTHNYPLDQRILPQIVAMNPFYLGVLGPKSRTARLFAEIGIPVPSSARAPMGLDLGSDHPNSIALAIAAEIQAVLGRRSGGALSAREGPIHSPALEVGTPSMTEMQSAERPTFCEVLASSNV